MLMTMKIMKTTMIFMTGMDVREILPKSIMLLIPIHHRFVLTNKCQDSVKAQLQISSPNLTCRYCTFNVLNYGSMYKHVLQPNANPPKRQHQKMTAYQPAEKTLSKFVEKINVGEHCFLNICGI